MSISISTRRNLFGAFALASMCIPLPAQAWTDEQLVCMPDNLKGCDDLVAKAKTQQDLLQAYDRRSMIFANPQVKRFDEAIADEKKAIQLAKSLGQGGHDLGSLYFMLSLAYEGKDDPAGAIDALTGAIDVDNRVDWHLFRGRFYQATKQYDKALADFQVVIDNKPDLGLWEALTRSGTLYVQLAKYDKAIAAFTSALPLWSTSFDSYQAFLEAQNTLGVAYMHIKDYEKAFTCFNDNVVMIEKNKDNTNPADRLSPELIARSYHNRSKASLSASSDKMKAVYNAAMTDENKAIGLSEGRDTRMYSNRAHLSMAWITLAGAEEMELWRSRAISDFQKVLEITKTQPDAEMSNDASANLAFLKKP